MLNLRNRDKSNEDDNDPRQRDIDEILNSDVRINRRVVDKEKEFIALFMDNLKEAPQLDRNVMDKTLKEADKINKVLIDLKGRLEQVELISDKELKNPTKRDIIYRALNNSEIILLYNDLIRSYKDPEVSFVSKEAIKANIQSIVPFINDICFLIDKIIEDKFLYFGARPRQILTYALYDTSAGNNLIGNISNAVELYLKQFLSMYATFRFIQSSLLRNNYDLVSEENVEVEFDKIYSEYPAETKILIDNVIGGFGKEHTEAQNQAFERRKKLIESDNQAPLTSEQVGEIRNQIFGVPDRSHYVINPVREGTIEALIADNSDGAGAYQAGGTLTKEQFDLYKEVVKSYANYRARNSLENADKIRGLDLALHTMNENIKNGFPAHYQPPFEPYQSERFRASVLNRPVIPTREADVEESKGAYRGTTNPTTDEQLIEEVNRNPTINGIFKNYRINKATPLIDSFNKSIKLPFKFTDIKDDNQAKVRGLKVKCLNFWTSIYKLKFLIEPPIVDIDNYKADIEATYPLINNTTINAGNYLKKNVSGNRAPTNTICQRLKDDTLLLADDYINDDVDFNNDELTFIKNTISKEMEQQQRRGANIAPMIEGQGRRKFKKYSDLHFNDEKNEFYDY